MDLALILAPGSSLERPAPPLPFELLQLILSHLPSTNPYKSQRDLHSFGRVCRAWRAVTVEETRTSCTIDTQDAAKKLTSLLVGRRKKNDPPRVHQPKKLVLVAPASRNGTGGIFSKLLKAVPDLERVEVRVASFSTMGNGVDDPLGKAFRGALLGLSQLREFRFVAQKHCLYIQDEHLYEFLLEWRRLTVMYVDAPLRTAVRPEYYLPTDPDFFPARLTSLTLSLSNEFHASDWLIDALPAYFHTDRAQHLKHLHLHTIPHWLLDDDRGCQWISGISRIGSQLESVTLYSGLVDWRNRAIGVPLCPILPHLTSAHTLNLALDLFDPYRISPALSTLAHHSLGKLVLDAGSHRYDFGIETDVPAEDMVAFLREVERGKAERGYKEGLQKFIIIGRTLKVWAADKREEMKEIAERAEVDLYLA